MEAVTTAWREKNRDGREGVRVHVNKNGVRNGLRRRQGVCLRSCRGWYSSREMFQRKNSEAPLVHRRRVLLIGAEPSVQSLISTFLATMGWTCTVVQTKEEAPVILQREAFDAVLIDLGSSETSAEQAILRIRQTRPSLEDQMLLISNG